MMDGKREELEWPVGYSARFTPALELLDAHGNVVGIEGSELTNVASSAPGQGGMLMQMNSSGSALLQLYWNAVPTGMSMETPRRRSTVCSPVASRRHICPSPERMCQNSLTVACTVARFT